MGIRILGGVQTSTPCTSLAVDEARNSSSDANAFAPADSEAARRAVSLGSTTARTTMRPSVAFAAAMCALEIPPPPTIAIENSAMGYCARNEIVRARSGARVHSIWGCAGSPRHLADHDRQRRPFDARQNRRVHAPSARNRP